MMASGNPGILSEDPPFNPAKRLMVNLRSRLAGTGVVGVRIRSKPK